MDNTNAERQRRYIAKLKAAGPAAEARIRELEAEVARFKREVAALRLRDAQKAPREPKPVNEEIAALRRQLRQAQARIRDVIASPKGTVFISRANRRLIRSCLHPDGVEESRKRRYNEAFQIFEALPIRELDTGR